MAYFLEKQDTSRRRDASSVRVRKNASISPPEQSYPSDTLIPMENIWNVIGMGDIGAKKAKKKKASPKARIRKMPKASKASPKAKKRVVKKAASILKRAAKKGPKTLATAKRVVKKAIKKQVLKKIAKKRAVQLAKYKSVAAPQKREVFASLKPKTKKQLQTTALRRKTARRVKLSEKLLRTTQKAPARARIKAAAQAVLKQPISTKMADKILEEPKKVAALLKRAPLPSQLKPTPEEILETERPENAGRIPEPEEIPEDMTPEDIAPEEEDIPVPDEPEDAEPEEGEEEEEEEYEPEEEEYAEAEAEEAEAEAEEEAEGEPEEDEEEEEDPEGEEDEEVYQDDSEDMEMLSRYYDPGMMEYENVLGLSARRRPSAKKKRPSAKKKRVPRARKAGKPTAAGIPVRVVPSGSGILPKGRATGGESDSSIGPGGIPWTYIAVGAGLLLLLTSKKSSR